MRDCITPTVQNVKGPQLLKEEEKECGSAVIVGGLERLLKEPGKAR